MIKNKRWRVNLIYSTPSKNTMISHFFDEIDELAEIIEAGPCWTTLVAAELKYQRNVTGKQSAGTISDGKTI